ncbi:MAG: DUF3164 family protein [Treponemataceae bacterium]
MKGKVNNDGFVDLVHKMSKQSNQFMTDAQGRQVPVEMVKDIDKLRDQTVNDIMQKTFNMRDALKAFKKEIWSDIQEFLVLSAEEHGVKWGGKKGNITLTTYDGMYKVVVSINDNLQFNEKLQVAKQLIDECIQDWASDARPELKALIDNAFAVDKAGNISTTRVLGLRRINISDAKWIKAMQAITDSIQVVSSKKYMRFYQRLEDGSYQQIPLDISAL